MVPETPPPSGELQPVIRSIYDEHVKKFVSADSDVVHVDEATAQTLAEKQKLLQIHANASRNYFQEYPFVLDGAFHGHELSLVALRSKERRFDAIPRALEGDRQALKELITVFHESAKWLIEHESMDRYSEDERLKLAETDMLYSAALHLLVEGETLPPPDDATSGEDRRLYELLERLRKLIPE